LSPVITVQTGPRNARTDPETGLRYYTWRGTEYPSVTSVRNLAGMPHRLAAWRTNKVIERAMAEYPTLGQMLKTSTPEATATWLRQAMSVERDAAASLGTRVHDAAASGMTLDKAPADLAPFLLQYRSWLSDSHIDIVTVEKQVFNTAVGYAGTFDMIGRMKNGTYWLIDLKTGKGTYAEHALQLEAYARAEVVGEDDVVDVQATEYLHEVSGRAVLHLRPEGWSFKVIPASDETWIAFRGLLVFARWAHDHPTIDNLISATKTGSATPA
jgi:hypothetical protein